jgi:hypothetical protein
MPTLSLLRSKMVVCCITSFHVVMPSNSAKLGNRLLNLGCPERPLTTKDPKPDILLPIDDDAWDQDVRYLVECLL